jgi:hypothetical protein
VSCHGAIPEEVLARTTDATGVPENPKPNAGCGKVALLIQELLAPVFIGQKALLTGKNGLKTLEN